MYPPLSAWLSRHLLDRQGQHRVRVLENWRAAVKQDRLAPDARSALVNAALSGLLLHARERIPAFRELLRDEPVGDLDSVRGILSRLPLMTRAAIQSDPARWIDQAIVSREDATGGSSGTPMRFRVDAETQRRREASLVWADSLTGWMPGKRIAMLWGADRDVLVAHRSWRGRIRLLVENRRWFNAFDMGPDQMRLFHVELAHFRPHLLVGYAGSLDTYARWLEAEGIVPPYPLDAIVSSAETLAPTMRERVERIFRTDVYDRYGNRETGAIAAECRTHAGLHIHETDQFVEILSSDPERQPGPLVVTYLHNHAMPFIRYDTGDLAVWLPDAACTCGRTTRRLARIAGRQSDTIRTRSGKWIHGEYFTHLLYGVDAVRAFQFEQITLDDYVLRLEAAPGACRGREEEWRMTLLAQVGEGARIRFEYVDQIPVARSGKRKFTLSRLEAE